MESQILSNAVIGRVRVAQQDAHGLWVPRVDRRNQIQVEWGYIVAKAISQRNTGIYVNAMYLEFENMADPDDPVTAPIYTDTEGRDYFEDLVSSGTRDYLRLPISRTPSIDIGAGYTNYFTPGLTGNQVTFDVTTSSGIAGVHGKTFGAGVNSKLSGVALVSMPDASDRTKDFVFSRTYFAPDEQLVMLPSRQVNVAWSLLFQVASLTS